MTRRWYSPGKIPIQAVDMMAEEGRVVWPHIGWYEKFWGKMPGNAILLAGGER